MKTVRVDEIILASDPAQLYVTERGISPDGYPLAKKGVEVRLYNDLCSGAKIDVLENEERVLLTSKNKCVILDNYMLGDYVFKDDSENDIITFSIILFEEPVVGKDKNELVKGMI